MMQTSFRERSDTLERLLHSRTRYMRGRLLDEARVYLSGPMDFVASREQEKRQGWRSRVGQFMRERFGTTLYDPWNKPEVLGMPHYGKEDEFSAQVREQWTFEDSEEGDRKRAEISVHFWPTFHIDLRMVDTSDFLISYVPTNIYSVGTVHEIATARLQRKPVLMVCPPVVFSEVARLEEHLKERGDEAGLTLLKQVVERAPLKENLRGTPSLWYMALVDGHYFFDGFGFAPYLEEFGWERGHLDALEERFPPRRPLLPYLERLNAEIPPRWDHEQRAYVENSEWLILDQPDES